jgi:hypothetical protein
MWIRLSLAVGILCAARLFRSISIVAVVLEPSPDAVQWLLLSDFQFVESAAASALYDRLRGDGKCMIYITVQGEDRSASIQGFDLAETSKNSPSPAFFMPDLPLSDTDRSITPYGSVLSDTGILAICAYNANDILGVDLSTGRTAFEVRSVPCPNDVCFNPTDNNILFVAGGTGVWDAAGELTAAIPPHGAIYMVNLSDGAVTDLAVPGLHALSGVACTAHTLLVSQLHSITAVPLPAFEVTSLGTEPDTSVSIEGGHPVREADPVGISSTRVLWECTAEDTDRCYLADNLSWWEESQLLVALYREITPFAAALLQHSYVSTAMYFLGKALTTAYMYCVEGRVSPLSDAELLPWFHTLDVFPRVHFELFDVNTGDRRHFELDCSGLKTPDGSIFDGHVTHVHHHAGKIVLVNFLSKWVLVLDERVLREAVM